MRRIFFLLAASLITVTYPVLADPPQEDVLRPRLEGLIGLYVEFDPGLNFTLLDGNPYVRPLITSYEQETSLYRSAVGVAPYLGLSVGYEFSSHLGISFHAAYDDRFASNSGTMIDTCFVTDEVTGNSIANRMEARKEYSVRTRYISFALLPNYRFDNILFFVGPTVSIPFSRRIHETNSIVDDSPCFYLTPGDDTTRVISGAVTDIANVSTRISLKLGLGYVFNMTPWVDLVPQLALDVGLSNLLKQDETLRMTNPNRPEGSSVSVPVNHQIQLNTVQAIIGIRVHI